MRVAPLLVALLLAGCASRGALDCRPVTATSVETPGVDHPRLVEALRARGYQVEETVPEGGFAFSDPQLDRAWYAHRLRAVSWIPEMTPEGTRERDGDVLSLVWREDGTRLMVTTSAQRDLEALRARVHEFAERVGATREEADAWYDDALRHRRDAAYADGPDGGLRAVSQELEGRASGTFRFSELYADLSELPCCTEARIVRGSGDPYGHRSVAFPQWVFEFALAYATGERREGDLTLTASLSGGEGLGMSVRGDATPERAQAVLADALAELGLPAPTAPSAYRHEPRGGCDSIRV